MSMWSGLAIFVATAWDRLPKQWQVVGTSIVGMTGLAAGLVALMQPHVMPMTNDYDQNGDGSWTTWDALQMLPSSTSVALRPMLEVIAASLVVASVIALYLAVKDRPRLCLVVLAAAMVPIALSLADGIARMAPQFSLANVSRLLDKQLTDKDAVVYEGELDDASSLVFYLHRPFYLVNQPADDEMHITGGKDIAVSEDAILRHWGDPQAIYLIIGQDRVPYWQELLTTRFHIYHQVASVGQHVVLTNQL